MKLLDDTLASQSHPDHRSQYQHAVEHIILSRSARSTLSRSTIFMCAYTSDVLSPNCAYAKEGKHPHGSGAARTFRCCNSRSRRALKILRSRRAPKVQPEPSSSEDSLGSPGSRSANRSRRTPRVLQSSRRAPGTVRSETECSEQSLRGPPLPEVNSSWSPRLRSQHNEHEWRKTLMGPSPSVGRRHAPMEAPSARCRAVARNRKGLT